MRLSLVRAVAVVLIVWSLSPTAGADDPPKPPMTLTAQQDRQLMLDQLKIPASVMRRGPSGMNPKAADFQNTDEAKANPWPHLPEMMVTKGRKTVDTPELWWKVRRPEIVEYFDAEVYGRVPKDVPKVTWEAAPPNEGGFVPGGKGGAPAAPSVTKQLIGRVDNSAYPAITVNIRLTLILPANAPGPVPVMMDFGGGGGMRQYLAKGWGYALVNPGSIQADNGAGLTRGIIGLVNKGQPRKPEDWGSLRAWAWGASRALDYLETDPAVDAKQVGISGLSRYGKAALVAMAYEPRFAIGLIGSSGAGGAKLFRRNFGEQVENLAGSGEYHWMSGTFLKYGGPLAPCDLPVDAHELIALCAPRPTFISYGAITGPGAEGYWVDQRGSFMAAVAAGPAFKLLGKKDLGTTEMPAVGTALVDGELAWRMHSGGHTTAPNIDTFVAWASRYLKAPPATAPVVPPRQGKTETVTLFDGKTLDGWEGYPDLWSVKDGVIVARNDKPLKFSTYLLTKGRYTDFRLTFAAKLVESEMHSGVCFWGIVKPDVSKDPEADRTKYTYAGHLVMFPSGWGMYDLFGRNGLPVNGAPAKKVGRQHDWNDIEILAQGNRVRVAVNGSAVVDWRDPEPDRIKAGPIGLQLHSNKVPQEIRFKGLVLETFPREDRLLSAK